MAHGARGAEVAQAAMEEERHERGLRVLAALDAEGAAAVREGLADIAPDMAGFIVDFGYGDICSRPGLGLRSRQIATVAALTALGNAEPQLRFHIGGALGAGVRPEEIVEIMYVTGIFAGFPAALNGIAAAREVFRARGVAFEPSAEAVPDLPRRERGREALARISGGSGEQVLASLTDIAPDMAWFILDFSYGDILARTVLADRDKETAIIAAAVARGTMRPQLQVHLGAGLRVGLTREEIVEIIIQMALYAGFPAALNGLAAAREVFAGA